MSQFLKMLRKYNHRLNTDMTKRARRGEPPGQGLRLPEQMRPLPPGSAWGQDPFLPALSGRVSGWNAPAPRAGVLGSTKAVRVAILGERFQPFLHH